VDGLLDAASVGFSAMRAVRDGGAFVAVTPPTPPPSERDISIELVLARGDGTELAELVGLVDQGHLSLRVAKTFSLEQAVHAHLTLNKGGVRGGLVLVTTTEEGNR
jgi:NADPH:quinone reductase-like Zn-dependent oxidoreductase